MTRTESRGGHRRAEHALVLAGARGRLDAEGLATVAQCAQAVDDWREVLACAGAHGVERVVTANLCAAGDALPPAIRASFDQRFSEATALNLALTMQLSDILQRLDAHGIAAAAWKGPVLAVLGYGHVGLRPFGDLDIVVEPAAMARARSLMLGSGYTIDHHERQRMDGVFPPAGDAYLFRAVRDGRAAVEIHRRIWHWPLAVGLDTRALLLRAVIVEVAGRRLRTLGPEDQLLSLALHGTQHDWVEVRYAADVDAVARVPLNWTMVIDRARAAAMARILWVSLLLAHELFGTAIPGWVLAEARRDAGAVRLTGTLADRLFAPEARPPGGRLPPWSTVQLRSRERVRDRLRYCARAAIADWVMKLHWSRPIEEDRRAGQV